MSKSIENKIIKMRRQAGRDFKVFRRYYFPHYCNIPDAEFHHEMYDFLQGLTQKRGVKAAIAAPRDSGKSTVVSTIYAIYCICYRIEEFIVIISSTNDQASGFLSHIKNELETNERLISDFPEVCEVGTKPKPPRWTQKEIIARNGVAMIALGTGQQIRGRRNKEFRPSLIILDDIETDDTVQSPDSFHKLEDWVTKSVLKSGSPKTNVIYVGTIHHYGSLLAQFTNPNMFPGWEKRIYRSVISWSNNPHLWEEWVRIFNNHQEYHGSSGPDAARVFFEAQKDKMLEGTAVLWPQKKSYYDLMVMREQEGDVSFDSEMQNEPVNPRDCLYNVEEFHYWDDQFQTEGELFRSFLDGAVIYGACDPSMGKQNKRSDFSAIITVAMDKSTKKKYVLDADIQRRRPDKTLEDIMEYHIWRKYRSFGFETNHFQEYCAEQLRKNALQRGLSIPLEEIKHMSDKKGRIESLQPAIKSGEILFSRKHYALLEQFKYFPKGSHDDGPDALEMVIDLCRKHGSGFVFVGGYDVFPREEDYYTPYPIGCVVIPEITRHPPPPGW
jgi:predicted phage terminase large subunit-like protein